MINCLGSGDGETPARSCDVPCFTGHELTPRHSRYRLRSGNREPPQSLPRDGSDHRSLACWITASLPCPIGLADEGIEPDAVGLKSDWYRGCESTNVLQFPSVLPDEPLGWQTRSHRITRSSWSRADQFCASDQDSQGQGVDEQPATCQRLPANRARLCSQRGIKIDLTTHPCIPRPNLQPFITAQNEFYPGLAYAHSGNAGIERHFHSGSVKLGLVIDREQAHSCQKPGECNIEPRQQTAKSQHVPIQQAVIRPATLPMLYQGPNEPFRNDPLIFTQAAHALFVRSGKDNHARLWMAD